MVEKFGPKYKRHKGKTYEEIAYLNGYTDGILKSKQIIAKHHKPKQWKH